MSDDDSAWFAGKLSQSSQLKIEAQIATSLAFAREISRKLYASAEHREVIQKLQDCSTTLAEIESVFVGAERGKRIGSQVAITLNREARTYGCAAALNMLQLAGWDENDIADATDRVTPSLDVAEDKNRD